MGKKYTIFILILLAVVLTACGGDKKDKETDSKKETIEVTEAEKVPQDTIVLEVNNEKINGRKYNSAYIQTKMRLYQIGQDINDLEKVKESTLDELVAQELLRQEIDKKGIDIPKKEVETAYDGVKEENGSQIEAYMKEFDMSEAEFKEQLKYSLALEQYLDKEVKTPKVSKKEIEEMYDKLKKNNKDLPVYKDVEDIIKEQLERQKKEEQLRTILDSLKENAKINKLI